MTKIEFLVFIVLAALACASEDEGEQKKRGAGKPTSLNAIPTGAQKPDYTYIYQQSPQTSQPSQYQQVPNSFYPSQNSQYYSPPPQLDQTQYQQQQNYLLPPTTPSQFVPLNFIPANPGYQAKYQLVPSKTANGNIQLILQPQQGYQSPLLQYPQTLLPSPHGQFQPQQASLLNPISPQGHFNVAPNYQSLLGGYNLGHPSPMLLVAQPNPSLYNNFLYPNQGQNLYNYYPSNTQTKYASSFPSTSQNVEYDKPPAQQNISKEDNDINLHSGEYASAPSDTTYKNTYATSRSQTYSKL